MNPPPLVEDPESSTDPVRKNMPSRRLADSSRSVEANSIKESYRI